MKITTKLILLGMVGITAAPFILKKPDGSPYVTLQDIKQATSQTLTQSKKSLSEPQQMYKWQDSEGKWHYSDQPSGQYQSNKVQVKAAVNQMKDIELPEGFGESEKSKNDRFDPTSGGSGLPITTAPLEKVPDMLKEIEGLQDKMDQRQKALDDL